MRLPEGPSQRPVRRSDPSSRPAHPTTTRCAHENLGAAPLHLHPTCQTAADLEFRRRCSKYSTAIGTSEAITIKISTISMLFLMNGTLPRKYPAMVTPHAQRT